MNNLKTRLKNREPLIGSLVTLASPDVTEIMSHIGFDYLWIETEHAPTDYLLAQTLIQAVGGRCPCLVRVPDNQEVWFKKALDIGPAGVVVPQIKSATEAQASVEWCFYPPKGKRSVGVSRAHRYGMAFQDYVNRVNDELVLVLQVEHIEGVKNIQSIVQVPGIDAILIGPFDLSGSLDVLGQIDHPKVQQAIEEIKHHCDASNLPRGIFAVDAPYAVNAIDDGFNLIALSMDAFFLWGAAQAALNQVRGESLQCKS